MLGWLRRAAWRASRRKRSRAPGLSTRRVVSTFRATSRPRRGIDGLVDGAHAAGGDVGNHFVFADAGGGKKGMRRHDGAPPAARGSRRKKRRPVTETSLSPARAGGHGALPPASSMIHFSRRNGSAKPASQRRFMSHDDLQDVPEQRGDGREQCEGRRDVLVGAVVQHHVGCVVQDVARHQNHHRGREEHAEVESDEYGDHDQAQRDEAADGQDRPQEGEILLRHEDGERQPREHGQGEDAGGRDDVGARSSGSPR